MYGHRFSKDGEKVRWADRVRDVGLAIVALSIFGVPTILFAMDDYAIQEHSVMATHNAVVVTVNYRGIEHIEYTTNTGERISTYLHRRMNSSGSAHPGDVIKVKYVSDDPSHAYPADYQPRYYPAMIPGGFFLLVAALAAWFIPKEWRDRNRDWAAKNARRQA